MRGILATLFVLVLVACGWTALWFYGAHEASRQIDAWLAAEESQGRQWTCPAREITGYPLALTLSCTKPTFSGHALGESVQAGVAHLTAELGLLHPTTLALALAPPFTYRTSDGATDLRGRWTHLTADLDGLPDIANVSLAGRDVVLDGQFGPAGRQSLASASLDAKIGVPKSASNPTSDFAITVGGTDIPQIDELVGDTKPSNLHFVGQIDRLDIGDARTPEDAIDQWRRAGGHIELASSRISRGSAKVLGFGHLRLDEAHRPQGRIDAQFVGLEPILQKYGISPKIATAGAFLNTLLGGSPKNRPTEPGAISLPINLLDGRLAIGPIRTDIVLQPLY